MTFEGDLQGAGSIINVDELQNHGINAGDISKLKAAGVCSIAVSGGVSSKRRFVTNYKSQYCPQQGEICAKSKD